MTPNFAEQAKAWRHKQTMTAGEDYIANLAFLAGCEHGYRVGKDERPTKDEIADTNIENGFLREELDQLKQQLEFAQGRQEHWFKEAMEVRGEANQLRTRLEDAEKALKFYIQCDDDSECLQSRQPSNWDKPCGFQARAYFAKHPQDSAKGDL